jgi:hypothetical protein
MLCVGYLRQSVSCSECTEGKYVDLYCKQMKANVGIEITVVDRARIAIKRNLVDGHLHFDLIPILLL